MFDRTKAQPSVSARVLPRIGRCHARRGGWRIQNAAPLRQLSRMSNPLSMWCTVVACAIKSWSTASE